MEESGYSQIEKIMCAADMLFNGEPPESIEDCAKAVIWYLKDWNHDNSPGKKEDEMPVMDFDADQWRIYAAFLRQYHIDLDRADMHFWIFMGLLTNLEECRFTRVMEIRQMKIDPKMSTEQKRAAREAKKIYGITEPEEEQISPAREEFLALAGISR